MLFGTSTSVSASASGEGEFFRPFVSRVQTSRLPAKLNFQDIFCMAVRARAVSSNFQATFCDSVS